MADQAEVHRILVDARNLIDREGWAKEARGGGPYCAMLAVGAARRGTGVFALDAARPLMAALGLKWWDEVGEWNDALGRTKSEVLAAFDKAIAQTAPEPADPFHDEHGVWELRV